MKRKYDFKRSLNSVGALLLVALLLFTGMPVSAFADEVENNGEATEGTPEIVSEAPSEDSSEKEAVFEEIVVTEETVVPNPDSLPSEEDLLQQYIDNLAFGDQQLDPPTQQAKPKLKAARRSKLNEAELNTYNLLKSFFSKMASGEESVAKIELQFEDIFPQAVLDARYTAADLGYDVILVENTDTGEWEFASEDVKDAVVSQYELDVRKVMDALLLDCPYDLYWYDKVLGAKPERRSRISAEYENGEWKAYCSPQSIYTFVFGVSDNYRAGEIGVEYVSWNFGTTEEPNVQIIETDTIKTTAASSAVAAAQAVVNANANLSDYEKLLAYKTYICGEVSYNKAAADDNNVPYGNPWQLIWVFDNDPDTNVVCEGYSKAFKFLCDLTEFDNKSIEAHIVTGKMDGGTGAGGHMWNLVSIDQKNYLVDVTNCDEGTIGYSDKLFMKGDEEENPNYYDLDINDSTISYTYDEDTVNAYSDSERTLAYDDYNPNVITVRFHAGEHGYYEDAEGYHHEYVVNELGLDGGTIDDYDCPEPTVNEGEYGYFTGDWLDSNGDKVQFPLTVTENTDLYAEWYSYLVLTLDAGTQGYFHEVEDEETGELTYQSTFEETYDEGNTVYTEYFPAPLPREGQKVAFTGWYRDEACTDKMTDETFEIHSNTTLYAGWGEAYTITFITEEPGTYFDDNNSEYVRNILKGDPITALPNIYDDNGRILLGFSNGEEVLSSSELEEHVPEADETWTLLWVDEGETFTVTYDAGAEGYMTYYEWNEEIQDSVKKTEQRKSEQIYAGSTIYVDSSETKPTVNLDSSKVFSHWALNGKKIEGDYLPTGDITLDAVYEDADYSIDFYYNVKNGSQSDPTHYLRINIKDGESIGSFWAPYDELPDQSTIIGWFTEPSGEGEPYYESDIEWITPTEDMQFYGLWQEYVLIRYNSGEEGYFDKYFDEGTQEDKYVLTSENQYSKGTEIPISDLATPKNKPGTGLAFNGWFTDADRTQKLTAPFVPLENMELYAGWTEGYTLTFERGDNEGGYFETPNGGASSIEVTVVKGKELKNIPHAYSEDEHYYLDKYINGERVLEPGQNNYVPEADETWTAEWYHQNKVTFDATDEGYMYKSNEWDDEIQGYRDYYHSTSYDYWIRDGGSINLDDYRPNTMPGSTKAFSHWSIGGEKVSGNYIPTEDVTVTANYADGYVLEFYANDKFFTQENILRGESIPYIYTPYYEGEGKYRFKAWEDEDGTQYTEDELSRLVPEGDMVFHAVWEEYITVTLISGEEGYIRRYFDGNIEDYVYLKEDEEIVGKNEVINTEDLPNANPVQGSKKAFIGWYKDEAKTEKVEGEVAFAEDVTLYAGWADAYTITLNSGLEGAYFDDINGEETTTTDFNVIQGKTISDIPYIYFDDYNHYEKIGYRNDETQEELDTLLGHEPKGDESWTAIWEHSNVVTFDAGEYGYMRIGYHWDDDTQEEIEVFETEISEPVKDGESIDLDSYRPHNHIGNRKVFDHWAIDGDEVTGTYTPKGDVTIQAVYADSGYAIEFYSEGILVQQINVKPGSMIGYPDNPTYTGEGQYMLAARQWKGEDNQEYDEYEVAEIIPTKDMRFDAVWVPYVILTLDAGGNGYFDFEEGEYFEQDRTWYPLDEDGEANPNINDYIPTPKPGVESKFTGWFYDVECTKPITEDSIVIRENTTIYAGWGSAWTITFDMNGGYYMSEEIITHEENVQYDTAYGKTGPIPSHEDYEHKSFAGKWNTKADGTGTEYPAEGLKTLKLNEDITLYAMWDDVYKITFDPNGGELESPDDESGLWYNTLQKGAPLGNAGNPLTKEREGYEHIGWSRKQDAEVAEVLSKIMATEDTTLYAVWEHSHKWGDPTYTWSKDNKSVTAMRKCLICEDEEEETVEVTSKVTKPATIDAEGETTYTATFENSAFKTQTKTVADIPKLEKNDISSATVSGLSNKTYNGKAQTQSPTVKVGNTTLKSGTDYTVSYKNNTNAGTATVTITGKGNYAGTKTATFKINPAKVTIPTGKTLTYNEKSQTGVTAAANYTVSGNTGTNAKSYTATAALKDKKNYTWSDGKTEDKKVTWKINPLSLAKADVAGVEDKPYTGKAVTQTPTVTLGGKTLKNGTDYTLSYKNNTKAGTATMTVTGKGNYSGTVNKTFSIIAKSKIWERIAGQTGFDTMAAITKKFGTAKNAVIAANTDFKDSLAAAGLAGALKAPMMLTNPGGLPNQTRDELKRMGVTTVYLVGSTKDVSAATENQIKNLGIKVVRITGNTPSQKAVNVAKKQPERSDTVIIATPSGFKDALSISPYAYATKSPVLYSENNKKLSAATVNYIKSAKFKKAIIVGGYIALPLDIETQLKGAGISANNITRLAGANGYATSQVIAEWGQGKLKNGTGTNGQGKGAKDLYYYAMIKYQPSVRMTANNVGISRGDTGPNNWRDALAGAALCGKNRAILLLVHDENTSNTAVTKASKPQIAHGYVFGGEAAVGKKSWNALVNSTK